jgi:3-deoxy-manno-octulosonate cytidylyltransferase (CMP-KDO synthetase)
MKIVGVIPARYNSSRFPGKPLADIKGKSMIWWVYQNVRKIKVLNSIYVATDDNRIFEHCEKYGIPVVMTKAEHPTHIDRVHEISKSIQADYYLVVCGDEPLIESENILKAVDFINERMNNKAFVLQLVKRFNKPTEVVDPSNIKVVVSSDGFANYMSRSPIPFPYKSTFFNYYKLIGVEIYNSFALDFFVDVKAGIYEKIEDITLMRFLENRINVNSIIVESNSISVDTKNDLEIVKEKMNNQLLG